MIGDLETLKGALPYLLDGLTITLLLTVGGALLAFVVSVVLGLMSLNRVPIVRWTASVVVEFFRGTSLVVQLFWLYFVLPVFTAAPWSDLLGREWGGLIPGLMALGLNYGAYGAEVVRGSINAVDDGQWEGATALNMSASTRMRHVIWPQAWALMLSGYNNLLIMLIKGTAAVTFISLHDFGYEIEELRKSTSTIFAYVVGFVIYFLIAWLLSKVLRVMEVRSRRRLGWSAGSAHANAGAAL